MYTNAEPEVLVKSIILMLASEAHCSTSLLEVTSFTAIKHYSLDKNIWLNHANSSVNVQFSKTVYIYKLIMLVL